MRDLENCRQEIDEIDAELVRLFERRMGVCRDVALYKQAHYMDILNPAREDAVLRSRAHQVGSPELAQSVMSLFGEIMRLSREEQRRYLEAQTETRLIAYSGVPGAFSASAAATASSVIVLKRMRAPDVANGFAPSSLDGVAAYTATPSPLASRLLRDWFSARLSCT